jgi:hypothetical protein
VKGIINKYGSIVRVWVGPLLIVGLADAKYVEVSKVALALRIKQKRQNYTEL